MMTSQVTCLIGQLINTNNLHVSRNLSILIVVLAELEEKNEIDKLLAGLWTSWWRHYYVIP